MPENKCIACGAVVPEGRQVCPRCVKKNEEKYEIEKAELIKSLGKVIQTGKTYTQYIEALAEQLLANFNITRKENGG